MCVNTQKLMSLPSLDKLGPSSKNPKTATTLPGNEFENVDEDSFRNILEFVRDPSSQKDADVGKIWTVCTSLNRGLQEMCDRSGVYERLCQIIGLGTQELLDKFGYILDDPESMTWKRALTILSKAQKELQSYDEEIYDESVSSKLFVNTTPFQRQSYAIGYWTADDQMKPQRMVLLALLVVLGFHKKEAVLQRWLAHEVASWQSVIDRNNVSILLKMGASPTQPYDRGFTDSLSALQTVRERVRGAQEQLQAERAVLDLMEGHVEGDS